MAGVTQRLVQSAGTTSVSQEAGRAVPFLRRHDDGAISATRSRRQIPWQHWWVSIRLAFTVAGIVLTLVAAADAATAVSILCAVYEPFGRLCNRRPHVVR